MHTLILMRHGTAVESHEAASDYARSLTPHGRLEVQNQASLLKTHVPELIIASSALRTAETASCVASSLKAEITLMLEPELYHAQSDAYFDILQMIPDDVQTIMLVGHNPSISNLANSLAKTTLSMAPAELIIFQANRDCDWAELTIRDFQRIL